MDWPARLLTSAVRRMSVERSEWGAAMLAELTQLQQPYERWRFALGCTRVALCVPRRGRLFQLIGNSTMKNIASSPGASALVSVLFTTPFLFLNTIVANRIDPFFSLLRPGLHTSPQEYVLLPLVLLLLPAGAFIALRPMLGQRKFYIVNSLLAAVLLIAFAAISYGLGMDIYRCEILQIPGCD